MAQLADDPRPAPLAAPRPLLFFFLNARSRSAALQPFALLRPVRAARRTHRRVLHILRRGQRDYPQLADDPRPAPLAAPRPLLFFFLNYCTVAQDVLRTDCL